MNIINRVIMHARFALLLVCVLTLLTPASAQTPPPSSITFVATSVADDESWSEATAAESAVDMSVFDSNQQTFAQTYTLASNVAKEKKVLSVLSSGVRSLEIEYTTATLSGAALPVSGKRYVVAPLGNSLVVTYPDLTSPPAEEIAFVQGDNPQLNQFWTFNKIFGSRTVVVGEEITVQKSFAEEFVNAQDGMVVDLLKLTLREIDDGAAVFDAVLEMHNDIKSNEKPTDEVKGRSKFSGRITIAMTGEVIVKTNCRPLKVAFSGTNGVSAKKTAFDPGEHPDGVGKEMRIEGSQGTMSFGTTFTY